MASDQQRRDVRGERETAPRPGQRAGDVRSQRRSEQAHAEIRDVTFPIAVRGYERQAVDAYVARVSRVIAELEAGSSPQAAVRQAMDRVGEQIGGVLQHARQAAEEITAEALAEAEAATANARSEAEQVMQGVELQAHQLRGRSKQQADEMIARAREQAAELMLRAEEQARAVREQVEPRLRELESDTQAVWDARRKLLEDLPRMATELMEIAGAATARFRRPPGTAAVPPQPGQQRPEGSLPDAGTGAASGAGRPAEPDLGGAAPAHRP